MENIRMSDIECHLKLILMSAMIEVAHGYKYLFLIVL